MIIDTPTVLSGLALLVTLVTAILNWRNGRNKPDVDAMQVAKDAQEVARDALDGQKTLSKELTDVKKHLTGSYEIRAIARFYPKPEITEMSIRLMPPVRRKAPAQTDSGS